MWPKYWSFSFSIIPSTECLGQFPLGLTKGLSRIFSNTTIRKHQFFGTQLSLWSSSIHDSHPYVTTGKTIALTGWTFVGKVKSQLFYMLSRLEKEMATHSSVLAWRIPGTGEPGELPSMGSRRVGHN